MNRRFEDAALHQLARLYGIQTAYYDMSRRRKRALADSLLAMLKALGAAIVTVNDVPNALREFNQYSWNQPVDPVTIVLDNNTPKLKIRLSSDFVDKSIAGYLTLENGEFRQNKWLLADLPTIDSSTIEGKRYLIKEAKLAASVPWGYHVLDMEIGGRVYETLIISAPQKAYRPPMRGKAWGVFAPLYSIHSDNSWGIGDYSDLERIMKWNNSKGGSITATLPLLSTFSDEYSPYRPVSRLFWNELYIDINAVPELDECDEARDILKSQQFQGSLNDVKRGNMVNYKEVMRLKRSLLESMCRRIFSRQSKRLAQLQEYIMNNPEAEEYARFRSVCEMQGKSWRLWPGSARNGLISDGDHDEQARRYYLYSQWLASEQMGHLCRRAESIGNDLYLDVPLGVHPEGYDAWKYSDCFIQNLSVGAPPDVLFTNGQNWGFEPPHPETMRRDGYSYMRKYMCHNMEHAGIIRLDHVMGLHRLFCIPQGMTAEQGVYLHYHSDEMYAVLSLQSHRSKTMIVGEDLGTVPYYVRPAMTKHGLFRMYVMNYEFESDRENPVHSVPRNAVASINTHDMFPCAAFWNGDDIVERNQLGFMVNDTVNEELKIRQALKATITEFLFKNGYLDNMAADTIDVLKACLNYLGSSRVRALVVNLEDLWLEMDPQNIPGTDKEVPNWSRKLRFSLEQIETMPQVVQILDMVNQTRKVASTVVR